MFAPKTQTPKPLAPPPKMPLPSAGLAPLWSPSLHRGAPRLAHLVIDPTAETSQTLSMLLSYPAHLLRMEVYSRRQNGGKPPAGRCNAEMTVAGPGQLSAKLVACGQDEGRPCPNCPKDRNMYTICIGHTKKSNGQVSTARARFATQINLRYLLTPHAARTDRAFGRARSRKGSWQGQG